MSLYWKLYLLPYLFCLVLSILRRKHFDYSVKKAIILSLLLLPMGYIGAKALFMIENPGRRLNWGGVSFYGTVLFVPLEQLIAAKIGKLHYGDLMDFTAPYGALCLCVNRIGCHFSGCCGAAPMMINGEPVTIPLQLIESGLDLLLCAYLFHREYAHRITVRGEQTCIFTLCYSFIRLVMEHYRDTPKDLLGMSNGQWLAIITAIIAFVILNLIRVRHPGQPAGIESALPEEPEAGSAPPESDGSV